MIYPLLLPLVQITHMDFIEEKSFEFQNFSIDPLPKNEYESCRFLNCNFSGSSLAEIRFSNCVFKDCNLSNADITGTFLQDIEFRDCKMLGLHFDACNRFGLALKFEGCMLNHSSFFQLQLAKTIFRNSQLQEVDFSECHLAQAVFDRCTMAGAVFERTNLEKADFRTSTDYAIDPELNRLKRARFSWPSAAGLLHKYNLHID